GAGGSSLISSLNFADGERGLPARKRMAREEPPLGDRSHSTANSVPRTRDQSASLTRRLVVKPLPGVSHTRSHAPDRGSVASRRTRRQPRPFQVLAGAVAAFGPQQAVNRASRSSFGSRPVSTPWFSRPKPSSLATSSKTMGVSPEKNSSITDETRALAA